MKINLSQLLIVSLLAGCSHSETPQSVTANYLSLMQQGDDSYIEYACMREKSDPEIESLITQMSSFQVQGITSEREGAFVAQVKGIQGSDEFSFQLPVRQTETIYQKAQDLVASLNTDALQTQEILKTSNAIGQGLDELGGLQPLKTPERLDYSLKKFCVMGTVLK
ncbi:hypothetical protein IQ260_02010 [Leptolyngbya cf. ectocarpi LEGE 11479]|uniref:Lipoprotein n=1 Tax=Leptolyngbya cf. ectocarpi LEGE 11479 TaxID=1828722 RepID=A0A928WY14_LEPEC|nr:hypothetical protein [Leptolyngbya ectocarpi]MBE9065422.1 hypothetical protein [Leptolyngbya cf. ectocarpi LEGE 11479]